MRRSLRRATSELGRAIAAFAAARRRTADAALPLTATGIPTRPASCGISRRMRCHSLTQRQSAYRAPSVVPRPAGATLHVPPGFEVEQFASGLDGPRRSARSRPTAMCSSPRAVQAGSASCVRCPGDSVARPQSAVFAEGMSYAVRHRLLAAGTGARASSMWRRPTGSCGSPYQSGDLRARGKPEVVVPHLPTGGHGHAIGFRRWAQHVVSVGSRRIGTAMACA